MTDPLSFFGEVALRSSLILATAFVLLWIMKRTSASERHLVTLLGLLVVVFVPVGLLLSPKISWTISLPRQTETSGPTQKMTAYLLEENKNSLPPASPSIAENKPSVLEILTISNGLAALIAGGMLVQVVLLGRAAWSWQRIRRQATKALLPGEALERVQIFAGAKAVPPIFASDQITVPLLAGWLRPAIILPAEATQWQSERLVMVLCHELAHFRRGDSLLLPLICVLRILYWWHPLVWLALARLRREREAACDDLVLNQNFRATDYADLIVATARRARALRWQSGALAMASPSHLGERIRAILNPRLNRKPASRTTVFTGLILAFALGWFFVAAQVQAEDKPLTPDSTAVTDAPKSQIYVELVLAEIDERTYQQQTAAIDEAVKNGDIPFLESTGGFRVLSRPAVYVKDGTKAEISVGKEIIQGDKSTPITTLTATSVLGANGKVTSVVTPSQTMGPSKTFLGIKLETTPSLSKDGTILLPFLYRVGEVTQYKDNANWAVDTPATKDELKARDGKSYGYWIGKQHAYSLFDILNSPGDPIKTLPPLSPSPNRLALIVTARRVDAKATASVSTAPPDASKPQIELEFKLIQIDEKTYISHQKEIDAEVANSDLVSLINTVNKLPGASLLSAPSVTTQDGLKAIIDIVREMPYATQFDRDKDGKLVPSDFKTRDLGLSIVALPTLTADGKAVDLWFHCQVSSFERFEDISPGVKLPVFDKVSTTTKVLMGEHGYAAWIGVPGPTRTYLPGQNGDNRPSTTSTSPKRILLLVSARPVPAEAQVASVPSNEMVRISLKYFQISEKTYSKQTATVADALAMTDALKRGDMSYFGRFYDFGLLIEPSVLIKVGEQGVIETVRKMSFPVKFIRDSTGKFIPSDTVTDRLVGMRFVFRPELLADGTISLSCFDEITNFEGWIKTNSQEEQPVFNTSRVNGKYALVTSKPFGTWVRTNFDDQYKLPSWKAGDPPSIYSQDAPKVRIGMIITANLYSADGSPIPAH